MVGVVGPTSVELKEEYLPMGSTREQPKPHLLEVEHRVWGTGTALVFGAAGSLQSTVVQLSALDIIGQLGIFILIES